MLGIISSTELLVTKQMKMLTNQAGGLTRNQRFLNKYLEVVTAFTKSLRHLEAKGFEPVTLGF